MIMNILQLLLYPMHLFTQSDGKYTNGLYLNFVIILVWIQFTLHALIFIIIYQLISLHDNDFNDVNTIDIFNLLNQTL